MIGQLTIADDSFILELLNTEGWLKFIGDRNITSKDAAIAYIQKIIDSPHIAYFVVRLKESGDAIGIISFIQRDYLEHPDIGFAFLPSVSGNGYAYEATHAVLHKLIAERSLSSILATTLPGNISSIKLLKKMRFSFEKEMEIENEKLHVYRLIS